MSCVGKSDVYAFPLKMHNRIEPLRSHVVGEEILQTVARDDATTIVENGKPRVEIGVVAQHRLNEFAMKAIVQEELRIGFKVDKCAIFLFGIARNIRHKFAALKSSFAILSITMSASNKFLRKRIHSFQTHTIKTYRSSVLIVIILTSSVEFWHSRNQTAQRDATTIVTNRGCEIVLNINLNLFTESFVEFVDGVVDALFEQNVDSIFSMRTISQTSNIHTWTHTDVGHIVKMANGVFTIVRSVAYVGVKEFGHGEKW